VPAQRDTAATSGLGLLLAVVGSASYGLIITATRLAYDAGSNPITVICARAAVPAALIGLIMLARRQTFRLAPGAIGPMAGIALGQLGITIGYLGAVAYIPVSLAALVFFAHPVLVAVVLGLFGQSRVGWAAGLAFAAAFAGLTLALAPSFGLLDPRGLALAAGSAFSGTLLILAADRLPAAQDVLPVGLYMNLFALAAVAPYGLLTGAFAAPQSGLGWGAIAFVCLAYVVAFFGVVGAIRLAGALRAALVFNLEPVIAIVSAIAVLGEALDAAQILGVVLVFSALTLATLAERRRPAVAPPAE
jgi:drug/metabolite transporter (DMT)-like permease